MEDMTMIIGNCRKYYVNIRNVLKNRNKDGGLNAELFYDAIALNEDMRIIVSDIIGDKNAVDIRNKILFSCESFRSISKIMDVESDGSINKKKADELNYLNNSTGFAIFDGFATIARETHNSNTLAWALTVSRSISEQLREAERDGCC